MALRVLLADESSTIKKVMQLALQDYGVEVKSVPVGLDVIPVAKSFQPDIIFVDVLLQKKSGYDVAKDIKQDGHLKAVPVVLMWSGFMEIDEAKAVESGVERRLEKPFDAEILRNLVKDLVPRTLDNKISSYLTFPKLPEFDEPAPAPRAPAAAATPSRPAAPAEPADQSTSMPDLSAHSKSRINDDIYAIPEIGEDEALVEIPTSNDPADQFQNIPLSAAPIDKPGPATDESWSHQDLSKFKIQPPSESPKKAPAAGGTGGEFDKYMIPADELNLAHVESTGDFEEVTFVKPEPPVPKKAPAAPASPKATETQAAPATPRRDGPSAMDQVMAERILREEARAVLEKVAWQILPELCERVVKEELNKLLKDAERSI